MPEQRKPFYVHHRTKMVTDIVQQLSELFQTVCRLEIKPHLLFLHPSLKTSIVVYVHICDATRLVKQNKKKKYILFSKNLNCHSTNE